MNEKNRPRTGDEEATEAQFQLRLYIAGDGPNSTAAVRNLQRVCDKHLRDRCDIEIVDVLENPKRALEENVLVTPTLIKLSPRPAARVLGNLEDTEELLSALGLGGARDE